MIVVVASAIIRKSDAFLLVKETKPSTAGKWGLPGGKLEHGESIVDCIRREVREETGFSVVDENLLGIINKPNTHEGNTVVKFIFECGVTESLATPAEHEYAFLPLTAIYDLESRGLIRGAEVVSLIEAAAEQSGLNPFLRIIE